MKNLDELGFGPPDLSLPTGKCRNGHDWANNALVSISEKRGRIRTCLTCREGYNRKRTDVRAAKKHKLRGEVLKNFVGKKKKKK